MHLHVLSGGILNLRLVINRWKYIIKYQTAISPIYLARYVSKYASKTPYFPNKIAFFEYATAVYKLQMHRFQTKIKAISEGTEWVLLGIKKGSGCNTFMEMVSFFDEYIDNLVLVADKKLCPNCKNECDIKLDTLTDRLLFYCPYCRWKIYE